MSGTPADFNDGGEQAGAAAAFTVDVIVYPLDTLNTRFQSQDYVKTYAAGSRHRPLAPGGLYQGIGIVVLATLPAGERRPGRGSRPARADVPGRAAGVFFSTHEEAKRALSRRVPLPAPAVHACASGVAEMASCLVLAPAEVVKQNPQMLRRGPATAARASTSLQSFRRLRGAGGAQPALYRPTVPRLRAPVRAAVGGEEARALPPPARRARRDGPRRRGQRRGRGRRGCLPDDAQRRGQDAHHGERPAAAARSRGPSRGRGPWPSRCTASEASGAFSEARHFARHGRRLAARCTSGPTTRPSYGSGRGNPS